MGQGMSEKKRKQLIELAVDIQQNPVVKYEDRTYVARELVQLTLPHRQPAKVNNQVPPVWTRRNGDLTLIVKPGYQVDQASGEINCLGYPSGAIPRLLIFWLNSEVVKHKTLRVELDGSYNEFLRRIGFDPRTGGGVRGDAKRVAREAQRLFRSTISFEHATDNARTWVDMPVAQKGSVWWDVKKPDQENLFTSWIELGEDFYNCLIQNPVPLDSRILSYFRASPLGLDISAWLSHRIFSAEMKGQPSKITWHQMLGQFGAGYNCPKNFKKSAKPIFEKLKVLVPKLGVEVVSGGITISPNGQLLSNERSYS